ncbi:MAG: YdcF family protein [Anaerolineae bacterium]|nr:YdcF family protein [Anaerolineae bacterium]
MGLLAYIFRLQILIGLASLLIVDDPLQPADLIFVFNGEVETRPFHAAKLFKQGLAPQIVIAQAEDSPAVEIGLYPDETEVAVGVMRELGVPGENITVLQPLGGVTSTRDEAMMLDQYVKEHHLKRIVLVTSAFHTRRTRWISGRELAGSDAILTISAAPHWKFDQTNWWQKERGLIMFSNEYIKLFYYFALY